MPLVFPSSASIGQTYQSGSSGVFVFNGEAWDSQNANLSVLVPSASFALTSATSSFARTSSLTTAVSTSISNQNASHNVLFVDTVGLGNIQVDGGLRYNPNTDLLTTTSSFAVSASQAISSSFTTMNEWVDAGTITIGAITTAPTKGTIVYDDVRYRRINSTTFEVEYNLAQSTAGTAGSGTYLWSLPSGITWGAGVLTTTSNTVTDYINRTLITKGQLFNTSGTVERLLAIIPYSATQFRMIAADTGGQFSQVGSTYYALNNAGLSFKFSFYTTV